MLGFFKGTRDGVRAKDRDLKRGERNDLFWNFLRQIYVIQAPKKKTNDRNLVALQNSLTKYDHETITMQEMACRSVISRLELDLLERIPFE